MTQENKKPNLGVQAGQREATERSSKDTLNVAEKKVSVKRFCPLKESRCFEFCAWWIEGKCAVVRLVDVLAAR